MPMSDARPLVTRKRSVHRARALFSAVVLTFLASVAPVITSATSAQAASSVDGPITRSEVLQRSQSWIDEQVPYSQTQYHTNQYGTYRQDCSGYVSMSWHLGTSYTTASLPSLMNDIAKADLRPGDALWRRGGSPYVHHIALFVGWGDAAKTRPIVREEHATGTPAVQRTWTADWASTFSAKRYKNIVEDAPPPPPPPVIPPSKTAPLSAGRDFNGDGFDDVFWYGTGAGADNLWLGTATPGVFTKKDATPVGGDYTPVVGDFNGDGKSEILWYAPGPDSEWVWSWFGDADPDHLFLYSSPKNTQGNVMSVTGGYEPVSGDFDADGKDDIFWYSLTGGIDHVWYGGTNGFTDVQPPQVQRSNLTPIAGDFDADGRTDIFWYAPGSEPEALWRGSASRTFLPISTQQVYGSYSPIAGDFNADGKDDIYWYAYGPANDTLWLSNGGGAFTASGTNDAGGLYWVIGGNFNGDKLNGHRRDDIMWYAPGTAADSLWTQIGSAAFSRLTLIINGSYTPI